MKKTLLFLALTLLMAISSVYAQKQNVYFLENGGKRVSTKDSADYVRVISEPDSGSKLHNITEYNAKTGNVRFVGRTSDATEVNLEGQSISYFPSGKKRRMASYHDNNLDGDVYDYYPNGQLYTVVKFVQNKGLIITCNDSTGKALATKRTGRFLGYDPDFKYIEEEGRILSGLKDGGWSGIVVIDSDKLSYREVYLKGLLVMGATYKDTIIHKYLVREVAPQYQGGETAWKKFLKQTLQYPDEAREKNIRGKVYVQLTVEKDGSLTDLEILKSPSPLLSEEAIRVIHLSPNWIAAFRYGMIIKSQVTFPIDFGQVN